MRSVIRWSADGRPLVNSAIRSPTFGSLLSLSRACTAALLEQPGGRLAGGHRLQQVIGPRLSGRPSPGRCPSATGPGPSPARPPVPHRPPACADAASAWATRSRTSIRSSASASTLPSSGPPRTGSRFSEAPRTPPRAAGPGRSFFIAKSRMAVGAALELHRRSPGRGTPGPPGHPLARPLATSPSANAVSSWSNRDPALLLEAAL